MSPRSEIPEPWRTAMENAGFYSFRDVALRTGLGISTVSALMKGRRQSDERSVQAVADALRLPVTTTRRWAAAALGEPGPFELPLEANRLNRRQRNAIVELVRAMVDPGDQADQPAQVVDLARPGLPDFSRVAARRGESEGRRVRDEQDTHGENQ